MRLLEQRLLSLRAEKCLFGTDKQFRGVDKPFGGTLGRIFDCFDDDGGDRTYAAGGGLF